MAYSLTTFASEMEEPLFHRIDSAGDRRGRGTAMALWQSGVHIEVIALYLGHKHLETTRVHVEADLAMKEEAQRTIAPVLSLARRFQADDTLLAFLDSL